MGDSRLSSPYGQVVHLFGGALALGGLAGACFASYVSTSAAGSSNARSAAIRSNSRRWAIVGRRAYFLRVRIILGGSAFLIHSISWMTGAAWRGPNAKLRPRPRAAERAGWQGHSQSPGGHGQ